jgi:hypothetical protein
VDPSIDLAMTNWPTRPGRHHCGRVAIVPEVESLEVRELVSKLGRHWPLELVEAEARDCYCY